MKMVKSLLLSAAGLVAVSGAQAADLPVKAKPVEYVKICSLYGAGFYYIPGTDICMKIGGYIRWQQTWNPGASISNGPMSGPGGRQTRTDSVDWGQRSRAIATFDTRQQTAYGTLRTYLLMGFTHDSVGGAAPSLYATRAFIQIAGFTFGKATSFFDFASTAAAAYNAGYIANSDTGDPGQLVAAYTAQLGNGVSATIAAENARRYSLVQLTAGDYVIGTNPGAAIDNLGGASTLQDIVGNIRVDQAWGSAQISAALHDASAGYYGATEATGHPGNKWGWAVSGGLRLNAPMIGPGDYFQVHAIYTQGALKYAGTTTFGGMNSWSGNTVGYGFWEDGVYNTAAGTAPDVQLTTAWSVFASYEHFWTPSLRTSIYGNYLEVSHNSTANTAICATGTSFTAGDPGCNADWKYAVIGSRSQWNVTKDLYVGLDVSYMYLGSASPNSTNTITLAAVGAKPAAVYTVEDKDAFAATWRIHRDILP